jgi:multiple sugar transport system permease protein
MLAPTLVVLAATTILPLLYTVYLSFSDFSGGLTPDRLVGLDNYREAVTSADFWNAVLLALIFLVGALAVEVALGVTLAILLEEVSLRRTGVRVLLLWPAVLPPIATALIFKYLLQGEVGVISYYLAKLGYDQDWLSHGATALAVLTGVDVWQYTPFIVLLTSAALANVPREVHEAAAIDGAGRVRTVWHVVLPMLRPALVAIALLRFIDAVQVFPTIYVLTQGGPGRSTQLLTYYSYEVFFGRLDFGGGAALAIVVVLATLAAVLAFQWLARRLDHDMGETP